ncbi:uncharacterized protein LOC135848632 isoform X2 [Planococcus citri]|uniref:uncharacterized protein LOC135848632 isoform X2 n=1 Tax=Planococcus citri TaxID=170843 RepID=UPI0031F76A0B
MNNTKGVFCSCAVLILTTFTSYFTISYSSPAPLVGSEDLILNTVEPGYLQLIGSCAKPPSTPARSITYKCNGEYSEYCTAGRTVPEYTVVNISCNPGYFSLNGDSNETVSVCIDKKWIPAHTRCHKMCDRLYSNYMNVHLECFQGNKSIPCGEYSLTPGARVRSSCKLAHRYENYKSTYQEINCGEDGKWDAALIPCIPGCEKTPGSHFEAPWHVMFLHNDPETVHTCSGTIISPRLILTTEFCVHLQMKKEFKEDANATQYSLIVTRFPKYQRLYEIAEFRYFNQAKYTYNIGRIQTPMIVVLKEELEFNSFVSPANIQWENPSRLDMWNGTVQILYAVFFKFVQLVRFSNQQKMKTIGSQIRVSTMMDHSLKKGSSNDLADTFLGRPISYSINFLSHIACKERWTYPYFALFWANVLGGETTLVDNSFLLDANLMCLEYENDITYGIGSGVIVEENNCYFMRGIMGVALDLPKIIKKIDKSPWNNPPLKQSLDCDKEIPPELSKFGQNVKFWCDVTSRLKKLQKTTGNRSEIPRNFASSIDIADYIDWIKKVRDETENQ